MLPIHTAGKSDFLLFKCRIYIYKHQLTSKACLCCCCATLHPSVFTTSSWNLHSHSNKKWNCQQKEKEKPSHHWLFLLEIIDVTKKNLHPYYESVLMEENCTEMVTCELMWKFFCKTSRSTKMRNMLVGRTDGSVYWLHGSELTAVPGMFSVSDPYSILRPFSTELPYIYKTAEDKP